MKRRFPSRLLLVLAMLPALAAFALADTPEALEPELDMAAGITLPDGAIGVPGDADLVLEGEGLLLEGDALAPDGGLGDALVADGLADLQLSNDALLWTAEEAPRGPEDGVMASNDGGLEGRTGPVAADGGMDNDALFEAWMRRSLPGVGRGRSLRSALSGRAGLDGVNLSLYDALAPRIREVARGARTATVFKIDVDAVGMGGWQSLARLGVDDTDDVEGLGEALLAAAGFDAECILQALLADFPYDLFWFDKVSRGMSWGYSLQARTEDGARFARLGGMTANMAVAAAYSAAGTEGTYAVNALPARVSAAVANINAIVSANAGRDDLSRLRAYANEICRLVEYDDDAARDGDAPYGDPWQLVSVFDGEADTRVVCEGYAKGFKYLCDLSDFDGDVACELMSGGIPDAHMWNAVRMPDGRCYPVDITNSDAGSYCNERVFLKGCRARTGRSFKCDAFTYTYSDRTLATFPGEWLAMSPFNYGDGYAVEGFSGEYDGNAHGIRVTLTGNGTVSYGVEKGVYGDSQSPAWRDAGAHTVYFRVEIEGCDAVEDAAGVNVMPRTAKLSWTGTRLTYNGKAQGPVAAVGNLAPGDTCEVTVTGARKNAGSYRAKAARLSNANYALPKSATRAFVIARRTVGLKWSGTALTYNGERQKPAAKATGLVSGDKCKVTVSGGRRGAGSYTAKATGLSNRNYALPRARTKACVIRPRKVRLKWSNTRLKYNGKRQKPTATATGLVRGDVCRVTVGGAAKERGAYTATATRLSNRNYRLPAKVRVKFRIY